MNEFEQTLFARASRIAGLTGVEVSLIPGPPPQKRRFLWINCGLVDEIDSLSSEKVVFLGRGITATISNEIIDSANLEDDFEGIVVQLICKSDSGGIIRVYAVTLPIINIRGLPSISINDVIELRETETSMLDRVSVLL